MMLKREFFLTYVFSSCKGGDRKIVVVINIRILPTRMFRKTNT